MAEGKTNWFKKHKILTVALALVLVFIIAAAASGSDSNKTDSSSSNSSSEQSQQTPKNSTAKTGEPARDGKFEFVVKSIRSEEHTSELQSHVNLVCRLLL